MVIPAHLRERLKQRVCDYVTDNAQDGVPRRVAADKQAFLVYSDIGGAVLLSSDGRLWELPWDSEDAREADAQIRVLALVVGAQRFPELQELLPVRPASAPDCSGCHGTGNFAGRDHVKCGQCQGLGWVPEPSTVAGDEA